MLMGYEILYYQDGRLIASEGQRAGSPVAQRYRYQTIEEAIARLEREYASLNSLDSISKLHWAYPGTSLTFEFNSSSWEYRVEEFCPEYCVDWAAPIMWSFDA